MNAKSITPSEPSYAGSTPVRASTWIGLAGGLVLGVAPIAKWISPGTTTSALLLREVVWWTLGAAILVWLRFVEQQPIISVGIRRPTWKTFVFGLIAAIASTAVMGVYFAVIVPRFHLDISSSLAAQQLILHTPFWFRVLLVLRAAVVEELLYRGYLIEKILQISGQGRLALICSVGAFTIAHLSGWGAAHLIPVAIIGAIFALLYIWRRDLGSNWVGHFITDGLGFLTR